MAKSFFERSFQPKQRKGRLIPPYLVDKVEKGLKGSIEDIHKKTGQMSRRVFLKSTSCHSQRRNFHSKSTKFQKN